MNMEPKDQPFDYRWQTRPVPSASLPPSTPTMSATNQALTARSSCMEQHHTTTWQKSGYEPRAFLPNNFQQKYDPRFDPRTVQQLFDQTGKPLFDPGTKAYVDQNGKLSLFDPMDKAFADDRQSPAVDTIIDPISHSETPSPLPQQPLPSQHSNQIHGLQFVALPQQNQAPTQVQQQQVLLVIKEGQVVANGDQTTIAISHQQSVAMETLNVDTNLKVDTDLPLEEQLSPSMILEHAEVDDEDTDEEHQDDDKLPDTDDDYDPKDEEFVAKRLQEKELAMEALSADDSSIRRSNRKRRTATYREEFDIDLDNEDLELPEKNGAERKKRKSSKPVKVTPEAAAEDWTEAEEPEADLTSSKRKRNLLKSRGNYSWKKTNVWFGREKMARYLKLKERCGFKSECALINRMLTLMERSANEMEQKNDSGVADYSKIGKPAHGKHKRTGRMSIHAAGEDVDEFSNVRRADSNDRSEDDPQANLCLRVSPEVRRNWLEMIAQSKMTASTFLASLMISYQKENQIDVPRYQLLLKEKESHVPQAEHLDICACPPIETGSKDAEKKKKKKTKEVENIDDDDFIVHQVSDTNQTPGDTKPNRVVKYYECAVCHKIYKSFTFFYHLRTHKSHSFSCAKCGKQMPIRQPKRSRQATKCIYCSFQSHYRPILRNHYKEAHPLQCKPGQHYLCDICPKTFKSAATLRDHRYTHMEDNFEFQCEICKKFFANRRFLRVHLHGVHGNKSHACTEEGCERAFNTRNMLNTHIKRVHLKVRKVKCPFEECNKKFFSKCELAQHTRVYHTKEKCFTCSWEGCGKSFRAPYHLQVHTRIHTDTKPLKCPHCDYRARQRNALNWHLRKHGEGPHFDKLTKPTKARTPKQAPKTTAQPQQQQETQLVATRPMAAILDEHVGEIPMYTPQFTNFDFQNLQHHPNPFHGMELYHPQMPAFPQAIPQGSAHAHAPMQYQTL